MDDDESPSPPPPNPNPNPNATQTLAPSPQTLTLALPIQTPSPAGAGGGSSSGRDDCWSEGATSALIDAWGERYLDLNRGNLKQKHWQEVADAVTARDGYAKPPRTDVQCKNRVDTLKKKYKSEKSKPSPSVWPFFHRLDELVGPTTKPNPSAGPAPGPGFPQFPQKLRTKKRSRDVSPSPASASPERSDSLPPPAASARPPDGKVDVGELARAVLRLGEVYEKVERSKTRQAAEMERQRMGFVRELEMQRMQFFVKTQMELSQLRRNHHRRRRRHHRDGGSGDSLDDDNNNNNHHHHHRRNEGGGEDVGGEEDGVGNNSE